MATTEELILQIEGILSNGLESVVIGDRNLRYRSLQDLQTILNQLKRKTASNKQPFGISYVIPSNGL